MVKYGCNEKGERKDLSHKGEKLMTRKDFNNKYGMSDFTEGFVTFCVENNRGSRHIFKRYNISSSLMEKACELATSMGLANKITFTIGGEDVVCEYNHNEVEF
jgi:hypothetical protein